MKLTITIATIAAFAGSASAAQVIANGGFESGTGGDSDGWVEAGGPPAGIFSERTMNAPLAGDWSHEIIANGTDSAGASAVVLQNSIADGGMASLEELTTVQLSFDADVLLGPGGVGFYALKILDGTGAIVAETGLLNLNNGLNSYLTPALNVPAFGAAPMDVYAAFVEISVAAGAFQGSTASAKIDNVLVDGTLIPTPGVAGMLALGGLAATRRRR